MRKSTSSSKNCRPSSKPAGPVPLLAWQASNAERLEYLEYSNDLWQLEIIMEDKSLMDQCKIEVAASRQFREEIPGVVDQLVLSCSRGELLRPRRPGTHPLAGCGHRYRAQDLPHPLPRLFHPHTPRAVQSELLFRAGGDGAFRRSVRTDDRCPPARLHPPQSALRAV